MNIDVNIELSSIHELNHEYSPQGLKKINPKDLSVSTSFRLSQAKGSILPIDLRVTYEVNKIEAPISIIEMSFDFHIDKLDEILVASDNKQSIKFNVDIIPDLIAIACDTMRGIVFEKNKGTILEKFILPLRDYKSDMGKHKKK